MLIPAVQLAWAQNPIVRQDTLIQPTIRNASVFGGISPYQNLFNHYDPIAQSKPIGPTVPFVQILPGQTLLHGSPANGRLPDEVVRQLAQGQAATSAVLSFYKTARQ